MLACLKLKRRNVSGFRALYRDHSCMKAPGQPRYRVGCSPTTCTGACSKALMGFKWREQFYRFAVGTFGTTHGGNILSTILQPVLRKFRAMGIHLLDWVDDILFVVQNTNDPSHDPSTCGGESKCQHCAATFKKARELEKVVDEELSALGFLFSEKNEPPRQDGEFLGLGWDTKRGIYILSQDKAKSLAQKAQDLLNESSLTP